MDLLLIGGVITNCALSSMVGEANKAVDRFKLDIPIPITTNQIAEARYTCGFTWHRMVNGYLRLTNGWAFSFSEHGVMKILDWSRTYYDMPDTRNYSRFYGANHVKPKEAIEMVASRIRALGFPYLTNALAAKPTVTGPLKDPNGQIPYVQIEWRPKVGPPLRAEVDCDHGKILSIFSAQSLSDPGQSNNFSCCASFTNLMGANSPLDK